MALPNRKKIFKKWVRKFHLWAGLAIGSIIFIISVTGCLYVFKDEIQDILRKDAMFHNEANIDKKQVLPIHILEKKVNEYTQEKYPVHWVNIPIDRNESYRFYYYEKNPETTWNYFDEFIIYKSVYVNPYTGEVLGIYDEKNGFFGIVLAIHFSLLLARPIGSWVVGIATLLFIGMLITGIIIWWPKNKKARKQRFWFPKKNLKNWKKFNYDLHNILGFYASFIGIIIAITGSFYAFFFVRALIYLVFSGGLTQYPDFSEYKTTSPKTERTATTPDKIATQVEKLYPKAYGYSIDLGHEHLDEHSHPAFSIYIQQKKGVYYINNEVFFDENSGEMLYNRPHKEKNFGEKVIAANYDIHVGAILGLGGKILAFFVSLICASLPVTGFMIWWQRHKKRKVMFVKKME
ncbi:PepSY-associated TM helix domain-containing protein [Bernardetia sp.]|uniref:PepSY-associated TM helix domain-containing protein n=1 Tax=Bernardetia sp. TaxID=1937974 RepID=UPI0025C15AE3|nr:PepSY-associated TM helix domain-containing protein [Bernardetia sp.]